MFRCVPCFAVLFLAVCLFPMNAVAQAHSGAPGYGKSAENPGLSQGGVTPMAATSASSSRANGKRGKAHAAKPQFAGFIVLHQFAGAPNDGAFPFGAPLIMDAGGNLYGTTAQGGQYINDNVSGGTIFEISNSGTETVLHSFGVEGDGTDPNAGLLLDSSGNLRGTVYEDIGNESCGNGPCGGAFELAANGNYTFSIFDLAFHSPQGGLILDSSGALYGTVTGSNFGSGGGVFKIDTPSPLLYVFQGGSDGSNPSFENSLFMDSAGNLYGTTLFGGTGCAPTGCGTVFKLDPSFNETILWRFGGGTTDGCQPQGGVTMDASGNLYGAASSCGSGNAGTVWELSPGGTETVLYNFTGAPDGAGPPGGVILDGSGNLYGVTFSGGQFGQGAVFEINPSTQTETVLHSFSCTTDGCYPFSGLLMDGSGNLYGNNSEGGTGGCTIIGVPGCGTVWELLKMESSTTAVTSSANPSQFGQSVTFTATVAGQGSGGPTPTGSVTFYDGASALGSQPLSNGMAQYTAAALVVGGHSITAVYGGDSNFNGSTSAPLNQVVNPATTTTGVISSVNPSVYGQPVKFTASITPAYGGSTTGTVTFYDGATQLGSEAVSNNSAGVIVSTLAFGNHFITAVYSGDSNFTGSTSPQLIQLVAQASATVSLVSSQNPSLSGNPVTFTATITGQYGGSATGTVTFYEWSTVIGSAPVSSNTAGLTISTLPVGTDAITAVYSGDSNFAGGESLPLMQIVQVKTHGKTSAPPKP